MDKNLLEKHGFHHQKKYGQNFLKDERIPIRIAENCTDGEKSSEDGVSESLILEIGPGAGILTRELSKRYKKVVAVEIDKDLIPVLRESLSDCNNVDVINRDIMEVDLEETLSEYRKCENGELMPVSVCANLPYYITTPVIMKLLEDYGDFSYITVMVQKEVARRLCAKPKDADYGAITAAVNLYGSVSKLFDVSAGNFDPKPKVDSSVIKISLYKPGKYSEKQIKNASKVIKAAFSMRRKTLVNTLVGIAPEKYNTKEKLSELVCSVTDNPDSRGEELSTDMFVTLAEKLFCGLSLSELPPISKPV